MSRPDVSEPPLGKTARRGLFGTCINVSGGGSVDSGYFFNISNVSFINRGILFGILFVDNFKALLVFP